MLSIFFMTNIWRFIDYIFNNYLQVNAWSVIVRIESINYWNSYTLDLFYIHVELWGIFTTLNANKHTEVKKKENRFPNIEYLDSPSEDEINVMLTSWKN